MGIYVFVPHEYQEMIIGQIIISAGIVFCPAGGTRYSVVYILPHLSKHVKRFAKFFQYLKTDALRPTPHQSSNDDSFSFEEKPIEFSNTPKFFPRSWETNESATFKTFPLFTFPEYGNHICIANMILKGACTNLLKEKFSRTFGEGGAR